MLTKTSHTITCILIVVTQFGCTKHPVPSGDLNQQLLQAVIRNDLTMARGLLDAGANIETKDNYDATPLILAAQRADDAMIKMLLDHGANAAAKDRGGETALVEAARRSDDAMVKMLLMKSPDADDKAQALFESVRAGPAVIGVDLSSGKQLPKQKNPPWVETVTSLLDSGVPVDVRDEENSTPLISAAAHGQTEIAELLLAHGADINATDKYGNTPLIAAACECAVATMPSTYDIVKILLDRGAKVNARTNDGTTALMNAAGGFGSVEIARILIAKGADVRAKDKEGKTALAIAIESDRPERISLLKKAMAESR